MQPQRDLFAAASAYPHGLVYAPDFLDRKEETALLAAVSAFRTMRDSHDDHPFPPTGLK